MAEVKLREDEYEFEDLRLAFEVKLEMLDDATLQATSPDWYSNASASHAYKAHGNQADCAFRYLCFDTSSECSFAVAVAPFNNGE